MRKLMWFTIGFAAACAAGIYLGVGLWLAPVCATLGIAFFFFKQKITAVIATVCIGLAIGSLWSWGHDAIYLKEARLYDGKTENAVGTVTDYSYETNYGVAADSKVELEGKYYRIRLYTESKEPLQPGDVIEGKIRFRLTTADSLQGETYHQGDGIFLLGYVQKDFKLRKTESIFPQYWGAYIRMKLSKMICDVFPGDTAAFAVALLLGDSSMLTYEMDTDFKLSGIRHVIAVSGLHVSILISLVYILSIRKRYLSAIIGIPVLILFAAVIGFTPSVTRACIMQILMLLALALNKEYDPPTALAFAVLGMLCVNPRTIVSVSFQLSVGCLIGIFLFYERIKGFLLRKLKISKIKKLRDRVVFAAVSGVSITLSTMITTTPLSAAYFGTVSIVGVLTNLLTLWVISFIFIGILMVCVIGFAWLPLAKIIAWIIAWPIRYVILVAKLLGSLPHSAVYTCSSYVVIWIVMCYVLFVIFMFSKKKQPWLLLSGGALGLILAILLTWAEPLGDNYRVTVFDVGQGQSILIECDDKRYLVDCGGDSDKTAADTVTHYLLSRSITKLDGIILTHYDADHAGGVPLLLTGIDVETLYLPDTEDESGRRQALEETHGNIFWLSSYGELETEKMKLCMIPGKHDKVDNERSMCVLFQTENCAILITGDRSTVGEKALLQQVELPPVDILIAGHHGSGSSTGMELLTKIQPKIAVISVAENNYYGLPAEQTLYRLRLFGCRVYRTDLEGTIVFKG